MSSPPKTHSLLLAKKKKPPPPAAMIKRVDHVVRRPIASPAASSLSHSAKPSARSHLNGSARKEPTPKQSRTPTPSRPSSKEPVERLKAERTRKPNKRASPTVTTPQFSDDDDDDDEAEAQPKKRARVEEVIDPNRQIRDPEAFSKDGITDSTRIHAREIANSEKVAANRSLYEPFFRRLGPDEEDGEPVVKIEYPGATSEPEEWQIVKPVDSSDFSPIDSISKNMDIVRQHYLDEESAKKVFNYNGSGLYQALDRARKHGETHVAGARTEYIQVISRYNELIRAKRDDGTIASAVERMRTIPQEILLRVISETFSRTVSENLASLHRYESFSDNVYGELLPSFLTRIFKETRLRSDQVFVDMGSGVGNCVLQAALETGCTAWGCEMMANPARIAEMQAKEFRVRCKLWGLKPGPIHLIHDDFLQNEKIGEVLKTADVILLNNQAFTSELNDKLKYKFLDVKEGAHIVSLKYYRDPKYRIKDTTVNDPINVLTVQENDRYSNNVSWSNDPGKWYLHRKDSSELKAFRRG